jgi:hypothetical protein
MGRRSKGTVDHLVSVSKLKSSVPRDVRLQQVYNSSERYGDEVEPTNGGNDAKRQAHDQK